MKLISQLVFPLLLVVIVESQDPQFCGVPLRDRRVINGYPAENFEFPWQVPLFAKDRYQSSPRFRCSGTIISSESVLTAAHCVVDRIRTELYIGLPNGSTDYEDGEMIKVSEKSIHPYFDEYSHYDIAILHFAEPLRFSRGVWPVCLPDPTRNYTDDQVTLSGWGRTETGDISQNLLKVNLTVISIEECKEMLNQHFDEIGVLYPLSRTMWTSNLCAKEIDKTGCHGDSGGPLIYLDDSSGTPFYTQLGVVSWGSPECRPGMPNVYSSIPNQLYWIVKEMRGATLPAPGERMSS